MTIDDAQVVVALPILTLNAPASNSGNIVVNKPASGLSAVVGGQMAGKNRWTLALGNNGAESGTASGSDFSIDRYLNTGVYIDSPMSIIRATGVAQFLLPIVNGPSDATLKGNIEPITGALATIEALQGRRFHMLATPDKQEIGLIAQEVEPIVPEVIQHFDMINNETGEATPKLAVDYPKLTALLIEAVKELSAKVTALEAQIAAQ
jgi:hypothetical protein